MLQMKIISSSLSVGVPKTDLGLNVFSGTYIQFDVNGEIVTYGIATKFTGGKVNNTLVFGHIDSNWFEINPEHKEKLLGVRNKLAELEIAGLVPGYGSADIKLTVFDQYNSPWLSIELVSEPVRGLLVSDIKIRDRLLLIPKKTFSEKELEDAAATARKTLSRDNRRAF
jgi:hypothetical protein